MRKLFLLLLLNAGLCLNAQVTFMSQLPPVLHAKNQLWNLTVTNTKQAPAFAYFDLTFSDIATGFQLFTATTNEVSIPTGTRMIQFSGWNPIRYNYSDPSMDQVANSDFLPMGQFLVCYRLMVWDGDGFVKQQEECQPISIEPLSPPQLIYPENVDTIMEANPLFIWIGPSRSGNQQAMDYDLQLVEMLPQQSPADAMMNNIPLLFATSIKGVNYLYNGRPGLEPGKNYAWRVLVKERNTVVAQTETWMFTLKDTTSLLLTDKSPYHKLSKSGTSAYTVVNKVLKFEYHNMTKDTTCDMRLFDVSDQKHREVKIDLDKLSIKPGANYIAIPLYQIKGFKNKHIYHLRLYNRRNEVWELKFEYRDDM